MCSAQRHDSVVCGQLWPEDVKPKSLTQLCVRGAMLHASETWALSSDALNCLRHNERAMLRWICRVKLSDERNTAELYTTLNIPDLDTAIQIRRLGWYGHTHR